ncbi:MAG TPA: hypothetical protein VEV17_07720 [Bryobacteraceae bacterium]|nr:hypothetical protein [Bryobacteraceae bacterium]
MNSMGQVFGVWTIRGRSTFAGSARPKVLTIRIEDHRGGEALTVNTVAEDGRATTFSTILFFDGKAREFHDFSCSGTQKSRRLDRRAVEILRECVGGRHIRLLRRDVQLGMLIFEITEQDGEGRRSEQRLFMEKH